MNRILRIIIVIAAEIILKFILTEFRDEDHYYY